MKKIMGYGVGVFFALIILPAIIGLFFNSISKETPEIKIEVKEEEKVKSSFKVKVYLHEKGKIQEMELEDYLIGVVAKEVPANFELEAIKAQAVAARTYTLKRMKSNGGAGTKYNEEADISTDPAECQGWMDEEEMKTKWMEKYEEYRKKIESAVMATKGEILVYNDELITAFFHSTSGGRTENVEDIYGAKLPYLRSVESEGEESTPKYIDIKIMEEEEVKKILREKFPSIKLQDNIPILKQITNELRGEGGRIKKIQIGSETIKGEDLRFALGLNSSNIVFENHENKLRIITKGYGHGVGMSQYGANIMAQKGKNYEEILKHYYQGVEIIEKEIKKEIEKEIEQ